MSQPDYIDILRIAKSMGIKPSPSKVGGYGEPSPHVLSEEEVLKMRDELAMCKMIIQHFDREFRRMNQSLVQVNKNMQEIARYRVSWMTGGIPSDSRIAKDLPKEWFDNEEVVA